MVRIRRLTAVALVLAGGFLHPAVASAGSFWDWLCTPCQPPCYSCFRYWTPTLARTRDCLCGPHIAVYAPDRHPESPPTFAIIHYKCPAVPPGATIIPVPTPPPESRFEYFARPGGNNTAAASGEKQGGEAMDKRTGTSTDKR